jgi:murein DD-endopeptidase MepM/ murein hydrolase activator NlpD
MAILSIAQTIAYAKAAKFTGEPLVNIVAIAIAESNLNTEIVNSIGATGILQILLPVHPDVTASQAKDPAFSFRYAYKLSGGGANLCAWQSYSSSICGIGWDNRWSQYVPQVRAAIGSPSTNTPVVLPTGGTQWFQYPINQGNDYVLSYKGVGTDTPHAAVDVEAPQDTPFYFLEPGTIVKADYQAWGGQVFEQPAGKNYQEYVYHLDQIDVKVGQQVKAGQRIGLSGGQTSGGSHPTSTQYSTGAHIHFGEFTKYEDSENGVIPFGPDPNPLIDAAKNGTLSTSGSGTATLSDTISSGTTEETPIPLSVRVNAILAKFPGFEGVAIALDTAETFPGVIWYNVNSTATAPQIPSWIPGAGAINAVDDVVFDGSDYIGAGIRSVLDTVVSNTTPLIFRALIVGVGLLLVGGLIANAVKGSGLIDMAEMAA